MDSENVIIDILKYYWYCTGVIAIEMTMATLLLLLFNHNRPKCIEFCLRYVKPQHRRVLLDCHLIITYIDDEVTIENLHQ
jgi:hypothetical protein